MGKKKQAPLVLGQREWQRFCAEPAALNALVEQGRATDIVRGLAAALLPGGSLQTAPLQLRLQVLALLEAHAVELCSDVPQDAVRHVFECVRDRAAQAGTDSPEGAARVQLAALRALTTMLIKLDMPQRDARLVKVHVEALFRIMERSGPHSTAAPELCHAAATCLRRMEEAAPTLLLVGAKQLLELARQETSGAAESYVMLAARVLSHGAARCLDQLSAQHSTEGGPTEQAEQGGGEEEQEGRAEDALSSLLSSIDVRALSLGVGASELLIPGARTVSPVGTLDATALAAAGTPAFASGRTVGSSEGFSSPKDAPDSPRGVASLIGTASTLDNSSRSFSAMAVPRLVPGAGPAHGLPIASSEISGSVQLDGSAPQPLLSASGPGLRHYRVPQHIHWPDALGHAALSVYATDDALKDVRSACIEFLSALSRMSVEGVACLTSALPPIMRLADLPPAQLQESLDALLHSGRTLLLQAVLKLYPEVPPEGYADWQRRLVDAVLMMVNGPHPAEHRVIAITWALVQHHAQMHSRRASLFAGSWRQLMPRPDDPPQLLSLKIKALSACLAVGIGRAEEVCPMVFSWDGFWQRTPTDQQLRLATYALRMLGSAAVSYAAAPAAAVEAARRPAAAAGGAAAFIAPDATRKAASPHYVKACLVSSCLQLLATRPQYLPAVDAFLAHCGSSCSELQHALLNAADALLSAAAGGSFACLAPPRRRGVPVRKQRSRLFGGGGSSLGESASSHGSGSPDSNGGSPTKQGLSGVLARMKRGVSKRFASLSPASSPASDPAVGSLQAAAECGIGEGAGGAGAGTGGGAGLPPIAEVALTMAAPQPPANLASWEDAEAWLWDSRTWGALSANLLSHDPIAYRPLLLRLAQSGTDVLPMGALRLLASYASQYQGELPSHELPAREAGSAVLAICQAAAMTHLLIGPRGTRRGRQQARGGGGDAEGSVHRGVHGGSAGAGEAAADVDSASSAQSASLTPQWTLQQEEIAAAMQAVLSALTSCFPSESVRRRAQSFLDLLANPSAWDLRVRMGTMAKLLGSYFSDAVSAANYL